MRTSYDSLKLKAGRDNNGHQRHRRLDIRTTEVDYVLPRIIETQKVWDEENERWRTMKVERRPHLNITTKVVACRNRFGIVKLYGPQGF